MKLRQTFEVDQVLTDPTSWKASDADATYGVRRKDTGAIAVADDTAWTKVSTGVYEIEWTAVEGVTYEVAREIVHNGETYWDVLEVAGLADEAFDGYLTAAECDVFALRVADITAWSNATTAERARAVNQATDQIDSLRLAGQKYDAGQARQFPRFAPHDIAQWPPGKTRPSGDIWDYDEYDGLAVVPTEVRLACFYQALSILRDGSTRDERLRDKHDGVAAQSAGGVSESYAPGESEILCLEAARLVRKYTIRSARIV